MDTEEDIQKDEYGNCLVSLDIEDYEIEKCFRAYMLSNNYSFASNCHFKLGLKEGNTLNEAMGSTVFNEWVVKACEEAVKDFKEKDKINQRLKKLRYC